jgi:hypothetical protein
MFKHNSRFNDSFQQFNNLTNKFTYKTRDYPVVTVIINTPSTRLIAMLKVSDEKYIINQYDINTNETVMEIAINGEYIKS